MADQVAGSLSPFLRRQRFKMASPFIRGKTLDYGCGIGLLCELLPIADYTGVDADAMLLEMARKRYSDRIFYHVDALPRDKLFDTIISLAVIEHVSEPVDLLLEFKGLLKAQGRIILTTPNPSFDWLHGFGAALGLFSCEAHEEHQSLLNKQAIQDLQRNTGLTLVVYRRFLFGANQLAIFEHASSN